MQKRIKLLKNQKGMTLVELLAVLVILGIIAAIAIPMIGNVIENSRNKADINEALSIISAAKMAYANGEYGKDSSGAAITNPSNASAFIYKKEDLASYLDSTIKNNGFTVTFNKTSWTIKDHPASNKLKGSGNAATESDLQKEID